MKIKQIFGKAVTSTQRGIEQMKRGVRKRRLLSLKHSPQRRKILADINTSNYWHTVFSKKAEEAEKRVKLIESGSNKYLAELPLRMQRDLLDTSRVELRNTTMSAHAHNIARIAAIPVVRELTSQRRAIRPLNRRAEAKKKA
ncbi:MAG: hypothetical protein WCW13_06145 [archaeon]